MAKWMKCLLLSLLVCHGSRAQLLDDDMLSFLQAMNYMSSIARNSAFMAPRVTRVPDWGQTELVTAIVREVLQAILQPSAIQRPPLSVTEPVPAMQTQTTRQSPSLATPPDVVVAENFFPSSFDVFQGTVQLR